MSSTLDKNRTRILGTVTIGQSPRADLIPELRQAMGLTRDDDGCADAEPAVRIMEAGALDGLTLEDVHKLRPEAGDYVLVTRMSDGTAVKIAERHILPRMQAQINSLAQRGADVIALVCTGEFPRFSCDRLLVEPQKILHHAVAALAQGRKIGVLMPDEDQIPQGTRRWSTVWTTAGASAEENIGEAHADQRGHTERLRIEAASPYGDPERISEAAARLRDWGADLIIMDCIGYTLAMKSVMRDVTGVPVVLARSILGRTLAELL